MSDLIGDSKVVIINMFTGLKETMIREVKEGIMTVSHLIDNIREEREMRDKRTRRDCAVQEHNRKLTRHFPGSPVNKTPSFQRRGRGFHPWPGN